YLRSNEDAIETFEANFELDDFVDDLENVVPRFISFNSFNDILPSGANASDVEKSVIIQRFFKVVGISPEHIFQSLSPQKRRKIVNNVSKDLTGDFGEFYKQSVVKLKLEVDGDEIQFYVHDGDNSTPYHPAQRSQGFQWFLSFFLTLRAESMTSSSIILIDEPGLYLHPTAQKDMLKILETLSESNQIVLTTHSPYLIDTDRLDRVRLITKDTDSEETTVENKIHRNGDKDTLRPIISAIGYDINQGVGISSKVNIITEGMSDYYYLMAFVQLVLPNSEHIKVIPAIGASQIPNIASILIGWGAPLLVLLDNDAEGKGIATKLKNKLGLEIEEDIFFVSSQNGEAIEDLFTKEDFYRYVLREDTQNKSNEKNSKVAKDNKVLLAKGFLDLIISSPDKLTLSTGSLEKIAILVDQLTKSLVLEGE
ncbi:MAG TPA: AAA family ATPase, partial [Bacilli bacterium]|nr:AAA family ATPase [Bacilli bacterium]